MIEITLDDREVQERLRQLQQHLGNLLPAMVQIGEALKISTQARFRTSTAPDGTPWAANSEVTLARYLNKTEGNRKKDGTLSKKGKTRLASKKPLIGESKRLSTQFAVQALRIIQPRQANPSIPLATDQEADAMPEAILNEDWENEEVLDIDDPRIPNAIRDFGAGFRNPARYVIDLGHGEYVLYGADGELLDLCYLK